VSHGFATPNARLRRRTNVTGHGDTATRRTLLGDAPEDGLPGRRPAATADDDAVGTDRRRRLDDDLVGVVADGTPTECDTPASVSASESARVVVSRGDGVGVDPRSSRRHPAEI